MVPVQPGAHVFTNVKNNDISEKNLPSSHMVSAQSGAHVFTNVKNNDISGKNNICFQKMPENSDTHAIMKHDPLVNICPKCIICLSKCENHYHEKFCGIYLPSQWVSQRIQSLDTNHQDIETCFQKMENIRLRPFCVNCASKYWYKILSNSFKDENSPILVNNDRAYTKCLKILFQNCVQNINKIESRWLSSVYNKAKVHEEGGEYYRYFRENILPLLVEDLNLWLQLSKDSREIIPTQGKIGYPVAVNLQYIILEKNKQISTLEEKLQIVQYDVKKQKINIEKHNDLKNVALFDKCIDQLLPGVDSLAHCAEPCQDLREVDFTMPEFKELKLTNFFEKLLEDHRPNVQDFDKIRRIAKNLTSQVLYVRSNGGFNKYHLAKTLLIMKKGDQKQTCKVLNNLGEITSYDMANTHKNNIIPKITDYEDTLHGPKKTIEHFDNNQVDHTMSRSHTKATIDGAKLKMDNFQGIVVETDIPEENFHLIEKLKKIDKKITDLKFCTNDESENIVKCEQEKKELQIQIDKNLKSLPLPPDAEAYRNETDPEKRKEIVLNTCNPVAEKAKIEALRVKFIRFVCQAICKKNQFKDEKNFPLLLIESGLFDVNKSFLKRKDPVLTRYSISMCFIKF